MSIAPIVQTVQVKANPARAFELFTSRIAQWWPVGRTIGRNPHVAIVIEPHIDGRWFERDAQGNETQWGKVLAWEPPERVLLAWQIDSTWHFNPQLVTEVELTFVPAAQGGTVVRLEHRNLERFGTDAAHHSDTLRGGWPKYFTLFAEYADTQT